MARMMADCRRFESDNNCTLTIIGEEEEVVTAALQHATSAHGHHDSAEFRDQVRAMLEPESSYAPGARTPQPLAG